MNSYEKRAREREKLLWDFYHRNGKKITTQDCYELMKTKNLKHTLDVFRKYGLKMPPRWGEPRTRTKRIADKLNAYADKLGVSELTTVEMAIALDRPKSEIYRVRQDCDRYEFKIPVLKIKSEWRRKRYESEKKRKSGDRQIIDEDMEMQDEYVEGLLILESRIRINPEDSNQVIYMLR